jgi:hypothetical protein
VSQEHPRLRGGRLWITRISTFCSRRCAAWFDKLTMRAVPERVQRHPLVDPGRLPTASLTQTFGHTLSKRCHDALLVHRKGRPLTGPRGKDSADRSRRGAWAPDYGVSRSVQPSTPSPRKNASTTSNTPAMRNPRRLHPGRMRQRLQTRRRCVNPRGKRSGQKVEYGRK